ncbi:MAG: biotin carboxylase N-terminal domain-containing protein [Mycetocola sp.]
MKPRRFNRVLVANRGEIACRVFRTIREMGIGTVAVYSDPDRGSRHARAADVAVALGGDSAADSYLCIDKLLDAAARAGADAVHPGYGFLSENAEFASACIDAGLVWIGPPPAAIASMARKVEAKELMGAAGVPLLPSATTEGDDSQVWLAAAARVGYPLLVKASAGGGGKGMRRVNDASALADAVSSGRREAEASFGDPTVFLERLLERPRHVEVQVLADSHGNVVHFFERDCSLQRRHQKVVEEARAPGLSDAIAVSLGQAAVRAASAVGYENAGTVEFLLDGGDHFFLEMNTRLQVEHPVTEEVCGIDLVRLQLEVAAGRALGISQDEIVATGHAIEARLYAEDPAREFLPSVGTVHRFMHPDLPGVRWDSGIESGSHVSPYYDPMLAKVIAHASTREEAADWLAVALRALQVHGVTTNRDSLVATLTNDNFIAGEFDTRFFEDHPELLAPQSSPHIRRLHAVGAALVLQRRRVGASLHGDLAPPGWRNVASTSSAQWFSCASSGMEGEVRVTLMHDELSSEPLAVAVDDEAVPCRPIEIGDRRIELEFDGLRYTCSVSSIDDRHWINGAGWQSELVERPRFRSYDTDAIGRGPRSPLPGTVVTVEVEPGRHVAAGELLVVIEAMKMEHRIVADADCVVLSLLVEVGEKVDANQLLVEVEYVSEEA